MYLSTPNTPGDPPRMLQHGVHVYEWEDSELRAVLADAGLTVTDTIGLLPPPPQATTQILAAPVRSRRRRMVHPAGRDHP